METEPDGGGTAARAPHRPVGGERREEARRRHPSHRVSLLSGYAWDLLPGSFSPAAARAAAAGFLISRKKTLTPCILEVHLRD